MTSSNTSSSSTQGSSIKSVFLMLGLVCLSVSCSACITSAVDPGYNSLVKSQDQIPVSGELGPGDKFEIRVFHEPDISGAFTVLADGSIRFPYIGHVSVVGKTCSSIESEISDRLKKGYLAEPAVSCTITEYNSKQILILGDVQKPGSYPYRSHSTIVHAIALAGGFQQRAARNKIQLTRQNGDSQLSVRIPVQDIVEGRQSNIKVMPGDIIFVPRSAL